MGATVPPFIMIKVFLLITIMSSPNWPSVKTSSYLYETEFQCMEAQVNFLNMYELQTDDFKNNIVLDAHCLEFNSFEIPGFNKTNLGV